MEVVDPVGGGFTGSGKAGPVDELGKYRKEETGSVGHGVKDKIYCMLSKCIGEDQKRLPYSCIASLQHSLTVCKTKGLKNDIHEDITNC